MKLSRSERDELIRVVGKASGIAQYALKKKVTDVQLIELKKHLSVLELLRDANNYNRYAQGQKTRAANEKLKQFMNPEHSEILSAGKWLINALTKRGEQRKATLLEKDLVHKTDYNGAVGEMADSLEEVREVSNEMNSNAEIKIKELQKRIDVLKKQLSMTQSFVTNNYGQSVWKDIRNKFEA